MDKSDIKYVIALGVMVAILAATILYTISPIEFEITEFSLDSITAGITKCIEIRFNVAIAAIVSEFLISAGVVAMLIRDERGDING